MYQIDEKDRVVALKDVPRPDSRDPLPVVLAKDGSVILSYIAGRSLTVMITFPFCAQHLFGMPGEKTLNLHPLAGRGLEPYGAYEVKDSSWVKAVKARYSGETRKHFVFTFRDTVFECVAVDLGVELIREDDDTIKLMSRRLYK